MLISSETINKIDGGSSTDLMVSGGEGRASSSESERLVCSEEVDLNRDVSAILNLQVHVWSVQRESINIPQASDLKGLELHTTQKDLLFKE